MVSKGIILAGGSGTRLYPVTHSVNKQLLPVYDKPMIYYPLSTLLLAGVNDILIISRIEDLRSYRDLLGDGSQLGIKISYEIQSHPRGLADAFILGADFVKKNSVWMILGDNIFYGHELRQNLEIQPKKSATIFAYWVDKPGGYGIIELDRQENPVSIEEKPENPRSNWAVTGLYYYDNSVVEIAKNLKPSARGELEITDINRIYLNKNQLEVRVLGRGNAWLDTGTHDSLLDASLFIQILEKRTGMKIGCPEEISYRMNNIDAKQLNKLSEQYNNDYGQYLRRVAIK